MAEPEAAQPGLCRDRERWLGHRLRGGAAEVKEWRPGTCGKLLGEVVVDDTGRRYLRVKCPGCSREAGEDRYHFLRLHPQVGAY